MGALVDFLNEYQSNSISDHIPALITGKYKICACLKDTDNKQVYLIQRQSDGKKCILKCFNQDCRENPEDEFNLHKSLSHIGLVPAVELIRQAGNCYLIRDYIEGNTITELVEMTKDGHLDDNRVIDITKQLCQVLHYLHSQKPPVIHRDIKPDNIIVTKAGTVKLIDFGISRRFDDEQEKDTVIMGTEYSAPPEQYGFMQTDARSDIYSLGVLMFYMTTGSMDIREADKLTISRTFRRCISKCTRFAPEARYDSVRSLEHHLNQQILLNRYYKSIQIAGIILLILGAFVSGCLLTLGYYRTYAQDRPEADLSSGTVVTQTEQAADSPSDVEATQTDIIDQTATISSSDTETIQSDMDQTAVDNPSDAEAFQPDTEQGDGDNTSDQTATFVTDETQEYRFTSELIEAAVRDELNLTEADIITVGDLKKVKELYICGQQVYQDWQEHFVYGAQQYLNGMTYKETGIYEINGYITSLEDIANMPYINTLALYNQTIKDLTPLAKLKYLVRLGLGANEIEDISPLSGLSNLNYLDISGNNITDEDLETIRQLPHLEQLDIGATKITSIYSIKDLPLTYLSVFDTELGDCDGLEDMTSLDQFITTGLNQTITPRALDTIRSMSNLRIVKIMGGQPFDPSVLSGLPNLWLLDLCGKETIDLDQFENSGIEQLFMDCCNDLNLTGIEKNQSLKLVSINDSVCYDYSPLLELKNLQEVICNPEEEEEIRKQLGDISFKITISEW